MSAVPSQIVGIGSWRGPGCDDRCHPRGHNPDAHEAYGYAQAVHAGLLRATRVVRTGPLVIDLDAETVTVAGVRVSFVSQQWAVLAFLASRPGKVCHYDEIVMAVWGAVVLHEPMRQRTYGAYNSAHHLLQIVVCRIRQKLGAAGALVETRIGSGYCLVMAEVVS